MTPEQQEQVRRALGSLPPVGPLPSEVAARLDAALADLVAEERHRPPTDPAQATDELTARRRRRRMLTGLVAAASVAVLGVGIGTVLDDTGPGASENASSGQAEDGAAREVAPEGAADSGGDSEAGAAAEPPAQLDPGTRYLAGAPRQVSSATLDQDVARVAELASAQSANRALADKDSSEAPGAQSLHPLPRALARCDVPATSRGDRLVPVRLDGDRATLVLRRPVAGTQEAQIFSCDDGSVLLANTVVPTG